MTLMIYAATSHNNIQPLLLHTIKYYSVVAMEWENLCDRNDSLVPFAKWKNGRLINDRD